MLVKLSRNSIRKIPFFQVLVVLFLVACNSHQDAVNPHLEKGKKLFEHGDFGEAMLELKTSSQHDQRGEAYYYMALMDEKRGSYKSMRQNLRRTLELDPSLIAARLKLGVLEIWFNNLDKAMEQADAVLKDHPNNLDAQILKATIYFRQGKDDEALQTLVVVEAADPKNLDVLSLKVGLYIKRGEYDQALSLIDIGLNKYASNIPLRFSRIKINAERNNSLAMIEDYKELVRHYPDVEDYKLKLAALYSMVDKPKEAEVLLKTMVEMSPDKLDPKIVLLEFLNAKSRDRVQPEYEQWVSSKKLTSIHVLELSKWMLANNFLDSAAKGLKQVVSNEQDQVLGLFAQTYLGEIALSRKQYGEVASIVDRVLKANSDFVDASLLKAKLLISENKLDEAIDLLDKTSWSRNDSGDAFLLLGQAYLAKNDLKQAEKNFKQALDVNPANMGAFFPVYESYLQSNQREFARRLLEKALLVKPNNELLLGVKVALDVEEKKWDDAETTVQRFAMFSKNKAMPFYLQANILQGRGKFAEAVSIYEKLLKDHPDDFKSMVNLARSYDGLKARDKAISFLQAHHDKYPDNLTVVGVLGELYFANHDFAKAKQLITEQLVRMPNAISLYLELARIEAVLRKSPDAAKEIYLKGLDANPDDIRLEFALAGWYQQTGDNVGAIKTYEQLLAKYPDSEVAINNLAQILLDSESGEDVKKGLELAERFKTSDKAIFQDTYAWGLIKTGQVSPGLKLLDSLISKDPKSAELRYHLAVAHLKNGNTATAMAELRQAVLLSDKQQMNFSGKNDAKKLLRELETNGKS
jgi:tetratricopeptide (TPR) repeat protein